MAVNEGMSPPEANNRAPSLVLWMIDDLADGMKSQMSEPTEIHPLPIQEISRGDSGDNGWEAGWEITSGPLRNTLTIFVSDDAPTQVNLIVNDQLIPIGIAPWIEHRTAGWTVEIDVELREMFRERLLTTVMFALELVEAGSA